MDLSEKSVLIVGVGGLGCPAAIALSEARVGRLILVDEDTVELSNLHRQLLFDDRDVGHDKLEAAAEHLRALARACQIETRPTRLLPENALELVSEADLVLEGADNFATKFLAADACHLAQKPLVHGACVRWQATAWVVAPSGRPCYRCLFEDLPPSAANQSCSEAGVAGPVAGFAGALMADLGLRVLSGDVTAFGAVSTYDGLLDRLRSVAVTPRADCALCSSDATIGSIDELRYTREICAA